MVFDDMAYLMAYHPGKPVFMPSTQIHKTNRNKDKSSWNSNREKSSRSYTAKVKLSLPIGTNPLVFCQFFGVTAAN